MTPNSVHPEQHRERIRWFESCAERGLRVYGQGATNRGGFLFTFEDWNLFDDSPAWRDVTLGTKDERKAKMQDPEMRRRLKEEWDSGTRPTRASQGSVGSLLVLTKNVKIDIGPESDFTKLPVTVEVGGASYLLMKGRDGYKLLSTLCPHQGGAIEDGEEAFVCDGHGYNFDKDGGRCITNPSLRMKSFVVSVKDGQLIASAPRRKCGHCR